jgi:CheY-like chemotaxis protein
MIKIMLEQMGYRVVEAADGVEALEVGNDNDRWRSFGYQSTRNGHEGTTRLHELPEFCNSFNRKARI